MDALSFELSVEMSDYMSTMHDIDALAQGRAACRDHSQRMLELLDPMLDDLHGMRCTGSP